MERAILSALLITVRMSNEHILKLVIMVHSESIKTPLLFHILLCCSLVLKSLKFISPSSIFTQYSIMTSKNFIYIFKCIKKDKLKYHIDISFQTLCPPLAVITA